MTVHHGRNDMGQEAEMTLPEALEVARTASECEEDDIFEALRILAQAYRDTRTIADHLEAHRRVISPRVVADYADRYIPDNHVPHDTPEGGRCWNPRYCTADWAANGGQA